MVIAGYVVLRVGKLWLWCIDGRTDCSFECLVLSFEWGFGVVIQFKVPMIWCFVGLDGGEF